MQRVFDFLKACGTYYLATVEGDQPRVRPFGTINLFENKLSECFKKYQPLFENKAILGLSST